MSTRHTATARNSSGTATCASPPTLPAQTAHRFSPANFCDRRTVADRTRRHILPGHQPSDVRQRRLPSRRADRLRPHRARSPLVAGLPGQQPVQQPGQCDGRPDHSLALHRLPHGDNAATNRHSHVSVGGRKAARRKSNRTTSHLHTPARRRDRHRGVACRALTTVHGIRSNPLPEGHPTNAQYRLRCGTRPGPNCTNWTLRRPDAPKSCTIRELIPQPTVCTFPNPLGHVSQPSSPPPQTRPQPIFVSATDIPISLPVRHRPGEVCAQREFYCSR